jgi:putative Ca2+/H+ antiporter (TMEM165/GDT1 family)
MDWGRNSHLWEGVIAGLVMVATWAAMTGSQLPAPLTPAILNVIGAAGVILLAVCGTWLGWRKVRC